MLNGKGEQNEMERQYSYTSEHQTTNKQMDSEQIIKPYICKVICSSLCSNWNSNADYK